MTTAVDMKEALESHGGIRGCRAAVAAINLANETGGTNKIKGISKFNNSEFTEDGIRAWCAYQIGPGNLVPYQGMKPQGKTGRSCCSLLVQFRRPEVFSRDPFAEDEPPKITANKQLFFSIVCIKKKQSGSGSYSDIR